MAISLGDYIDFICPKVGQSDATSRNLCRTFVKNRYRMIYDMHNWKDALDLRTGLTVGLDGIMDFPSGVDRIIAIRATGTHFVLPTDASYLMQVDPTMFERLGDPILWEEYLDTSVDTSDSVTMEVTAGARKIRFFPTPSIATPIIMQIKREFEELTADNQVPILRNIDQALIAFATGDMLQRQRQYAKAQLVFQEAQAALQMMLAGETSRAGFHAQVVPTPDIYESIYEEDSWLTSGQQGGATVPTDTESGVIALIPGQQYIDVTFANPKTAANYRFTQMVVIYTGSPPLTNIFVTMVSNITVNGFRANLNASPGGSGYQLYWGVTLP